MELRPSRIYENYRNKSLDKLSVIRLLIALIENNDDDTIRKDCIDILKKIDSNEEEIFKVSENILLSESNDDLRSSAATVIGKKFLKRSLNPFLWVLQYETSYKCLITIIMTFQNNSDSQIISKFAEDLREIPVDKFSNSLGSFLKECKDNELTSEKFVENLINHITITYLKKKFKKLNFKMDNGLVTELDFSEVDNLIINWRDRENLQDHSIIAGIINLKALKKVEFFPFKWVINNEFTFKSSIALLKVLERMNNNTSRDTLIYQIKNITDDKFNLSISTFLTPYQFLPRSKLTNIFRNYLTLSFLKKKYSSLEYKIIDGEVVSIYLRGETIISLPNFIKYLSSLRSISLKHCSLYTIPKSIGTFSNLKILDLEGNNLKVIPKTISSLESLRLLNLKNNQLIKLPYEFGKLMFLQYLNLEANNLIRLPSSLGNLSLLKYLSVKDNKLHELPSSIGNLKSLQVLCLSSNKLNQLPYSIGLLTSLELLNLDNNNLRELPTSINSLSSLKTLSIEDNNLTNLPKSLDLLKSLENLKLGWNKLHFLPNSIGNLISLKSLRLTNNNLQELPKTLCCLPLLESIQASSNQIKNIPSDISNLKLLRILKLSDNQLKALPESIYQLSLLQKFDFSGNHIRFLPKSMEELKLIRQLKLNNTLLVANPKTIVNVRSLK